MTHTAMPALAIYALTIERFRGVTSLKRRRSLGVNVIFGSDVGGIRPPAFRQTPKLGHAKMESAVTRWCID